jgi:hypothetical protein
MKNTCTILLASLAFLTTFLSKAQPVNGVTTFYTNTTTALMANTACSVTKTTSLSGWLFSISSTSNCGMNWTNSTGGDGRYQNLVGFGTLNEITFGSDDGSEFAMNYLVWGVSTSSWTSKPMQFMGYKDGSPVSGATLNATTPAGTGILNTLVVTFGSNMAFNNVDEIRLAPNSTTCNSILFFEEIGIGTACNSSPTITVAGSSSVSCKGGSTGSATMSVTGGTGFTYTWLPSGGNNAAAGNLSAGTYTLNATNDCGYTDSQTILIAEPALALTSSTALTNPLCNAGQGSATVSASGGVGAYTYSWSSGPTVSVEPTLLAGTYTVSVSDANNCTVISSVTISQPAAISIATAVTIPLCNGGNGSASVTITGGTGAYTYTWSSSATTSVAASLIAGTYTVRGADANNCTSSTMSVTITQPSGITVNTAVTNAACNGGNGTATLTVSGGTGAYTYSWSGGATTSLVNLPAGVYSATVTDANSCTNVKTVTLLQPAALNTSTAVTNVLCNGGSGSATITASGGTGAYTYLWSTGSTTSLSALLAGAYTATVTDANNCASTRSVIITQPSAIITATSVTSVLCNGGSGSASITASGGAGGYSYSWSSSSTASVAASLLAGVYTATVTDANNCTSTKSVTITQPVVLVSNTAATNPLCNGGTGSASVTVSGGSGAYSYSWTSSSTTSVAAGLLAGIYTVTVTDANNCTSTKSVTITQPAALVSTTAVTNALCVGGLGSASITASGGTGTYNYSWSSSSTSSVSAGLSPGVYTATVTDANNCTSTKSITISQPTAITTTVSVTGAPCNGSSGSASVIASGGTGAYTYSWSTSATGSVATALFAGIYTVSVTDANNCTTTTLVAISQPPAIVTATSVTNALCNGGLASATIIATGGTGAYSYSWSTSATSSVAANLPAGLYTATVTDANNCIGIKSVSVSQPPALVTTTAITNALCNGGFGSASITATGGTGAYTYSWSTSSTSSVSASLPAGIYTATVTDANGCTSSRSVTITQPATLVTNTSITNILCNGGFGSASITASGGTGAYSYSWSTTSTASVVANLPAGIYTATVSDANNCASTKSVAITQPTALLTSTSVTNVLCNGGFGSASVTASGGTGAYSYSWSTSSTASVAASLVAGVYSVTVKDANNCVSTKSVTITQPASMSLTAVASSATLCSGNSITLTASALGGTGLISYLWVSGPATATNLISPATGGIYVYTITATDLNSCSITRTVSATVFALPTITISSGAICPGNSFTLSPTGASNYVFLNGGPVVIPAVTTSYSVTGTSSAGCAATNTAVAIVTVTNSLQVGFTGSANICSGQSATLTANGAATYSWSTGVLTASIILTPSVNTSYTVFGISGTCTNNAVASVTVNTTPTLSIAGNNTLCAGSSVTYSVTGATTFSWTTGAITSTITETPTTNTTYIVTGTSPNGCSATASISTTVFSLPGVTVNSGTICAGSIFTIIPSGALTYTYSGGSATVTPVTSTAYTVTGTDANGCSDLTGDVSVVTVNALPTISVNSGAICEGMSFTINPSGATTYTISGGAWVVAPTITTTFSVTGTDNNGCVSLSPAASNVTVNSNPTVTATSSASQICSSESATLTAGGAVTYSWSIAQSGNAITVSPTVTSTYTVTGVDANNCSDTTAITQLVDQCLGILRQTIESGFGIFPNPNTGEFTVKLDDPRAGMLVQVYNSVGQLVLSSPVNDHSLQLRLDQKAKGIYTVRLSDKDRVISQKKLIVE